MILHFYLVFEVKDDKVGFLRIVLISTAITKCISFVFLITSNVAILDAQTKHSYSGQLPLKAIVFGVVD